MFSKQLSRIRKTISFRMALWYSCIFIGSSIAFFFIGSLLLSSSLRKGDHELIRYKLNEYAAVYQKGGLDVLKTAGAKDAGKYFVRLAGSKNETRFLALPSNFYEDDEIKSPKFELQRVQNQSVERTWSSVASKDQEDVLEIAAVHLSDGSALQVGKSTEERQDILERFQNVFLLVLVAVLVTGVAGGTILTYRAFEPVRQLTALTHSIVSTGKIDARVPIGRKNDELQQLALLSNQMLARIEMLIEGMKNSLDNVAHDLRTPVTRLRSAAEAALDSDDLERCKEALSDCLEESERVMAMLNTLMDISEAETGVMKLQFEMLDVSALVEDIVDLYRYVAEEKQISVSLSCSEEIHLPVDRNRLRQVIANLLDNAVKYTPAKGMISVTVEKSNSEVLLIVQDSGIGIPADDVPRVWERLYRGDKSRSQRGLGLGLSFVKAIVVAHHGTISLSSEPGKGTTFYVHLPLEQQNLVPAKV